MRTETVHEPASLTLCGGRKIYWTDLLKAEVGDVLARDAVQDGHDITRDVAKITWRTEHLVRVIVTTETEVPVARIEREDVQYYFCLRDFV